MTPAPKLPKGGNDWRYRNKAGGTVQGSPRRPGQKPPTVAEETAAKAKARADANQKKSPPKDSPAGPRKSKPVNNPALAGKFTPAGLTYAQQVEQRKKHEQDTKPEIAKLPKGGAKQSQPGPGAPTGGAGKDTPGAGKDRTDFEKNRQGWARGKGRGQGGNPRPPAYTPQDDGQRGGYVNRSKPIPPVPGKIPPIPKKKPGISTGGSSVVKGMSIRV
jgi:hypothetical protein